MMSVNNMDELIAQINTVVSGLDIPREDKLSLLVLLTKIGYEFKKAADAIEELQKDLERSKDFEAFWQHEAEEALKKFQVAISNKPKWVPVTERLPEDRTMVLATVNGVVCVAFYGNYMWEEVETYSIFYPTHWIPLPEPPESEGE